ncbi:hypothetical protein Sango_2617500 [Sesamum angolense]|uniref:Uncharacterized protein n=1 Tax=Sesamum angolense TaxID=2727404 RepID=A0AAE1TBU0_9LAMI|nr:hypothetical protein Sango_2617500 [Sesamum angolense]
MTTDLNPDPFANPWLRLVVPSNSHGRCHTSNPFKVDISCGKEKRNHLSGGIPTSIGDLSHLGVLNLSYNNLSGRIPQNSHGLTIPESAYIGNAGLCGRPLNKSCPGDESSCEDPNSRVDGNNVMKGGESEDDRFITEGFYITLGLGFVVGFWGILGQYCSTTDSDMHFSSSWTPLVI